MTKKLGLLLFRIVLLCCIKLWLSRMRVSQAANVVDSATIWARLAGSKSCSRCRARIHGGWELRLLLASMRSSVLPILLSSKYKSNNPEMRAIGIRQRLLCSIISKQMLAKPQRVSFAFR